MLMAYELMQQDPCPIPIAKSKYEPLVNQYLYLNNNNNNNNPLLNTTDLKDPTQEFTKLFNRAMSITNIVKNEYIDKKEK